ncbi:MAG TPA: DUF6051 family protein [Syntrophorhabdales bacterium]|nr:DUF6051 family protein [Syntrophorhabdales bacterium]
MRRKTVGTNQDWELPDVIEEKALFTSRASHYLLPEDRNTESNECFMFPVFRPAGQTFGDCLFLGHGLNETSYLKLKYWAKALCHNLRMPVLIFPLSFHVNRRPSSWLMRMRSLYRSRSQINENRCASPFNAVISHRFAEMPERFFRGALQSYCDIKDLTLLMRKGQFETMTGRGEQILAPTARINFLGYSITGYLYLALVMLMGDDLLSDSRVVLFSSCTHIRDMNPVSVLVIDEDAFRRSKQFYEGGYKEQASPEFRCWLHEEETGLWFKRLFFNEGGRDRLHDATRTLSNRVLIIGDPHDEVFPLEATKANLGGFLHCRAMALGRHEFPFNISDLKEKSFQELAEEIRGSEFPSENYRNTFVEWVNAVRDFLCPACAVVSADVES